MGVEHCVNRPESLVDVYHIIQCAFPWNQDGFTLKEGFVNMAHDSARAVAWYFATTKPFVVFAITNGQDVRKNSGITIATSLHKNGLRHLF
jgi:hypothetical protein